MTLDQIINLVVTVPVIEMMISVGLGVTFTDLLATLRNGRLIARSALANYICVPAVMVALLVLFDPPPLTSIGFLILAVCPGAPFGPAFAAIARGNVPVAVGLMVVLAGASVILGPIPLSVLVPLVVASDPPDIDTAGIVVTLLVTQLLPLGAGMALRR